MTRSARTHSLLLALLLSACASAHDGKPSTTGPEGHDAAAPPEATADASTPTPAPIVEALRRTPHANAMTEVVLDPTGRSALTLDDRGGLRLWPDVHDTAAPAPIELPEREPIWFTVAQADEGAFVVATIDVAGGARVARIALTETGAERRELFAVPANDPQFEIHVLAGGRRVLALGKDHRVRLFDDKGMVVSEIDQPGFIPWQLRVVQPPDRPVGIAAVLTQPVRAQSLTLENDTLRVVGEPWMVALDQSPNRNDMALSPDGKTIAALRRHGKRGRGFALQLIELATGNRRVIVGELDDKARPRLHYTDDTRVLLESGTGAGFWIELAQAVPRDATTFPPAVMTAVRLPGAPGDLRMQVTESAGVRAIAADAVLTIDPLADAGHLRITHTPLGRGPTALDAEGETVAWSQENRVFVERIGDGATTIGFDAGAPVQRLAYDEDGRLVVVTAAGMTVHDRDGAAIPSATSARLGPAFDAKLARVTATELGRALPLRGRSAVAAASAPDGSLVALALTSNTLQLSDRATTAATLTVFDHARREQLWSAPLGRVDVVEWSGDGHRIAAHDDASLVVYDARTGGIVFRRDAVRLQRESAAD